MVPDLTPLFVLATFGVVTGTLFAYLLVRWRTVGVTLWGDDRGTRSPGETVACPDCGTPNEPAYRFCRQCVSELPARVAGERPAVDASEQRA